MTDLTDTIEEFNRLDIQNSAVAFDLWLKSKLVKKNTKRIVEKDSKKNELAFKTWLRRKKELEKEENLKKQQELLSRAEKEKKDFDYSFKKQQLCLEKFEEWKRNKTVQRKQLERSKEIHAQQDTLRKMEKQEISQKNVEKYWKNLGTRRQSRVLHKQAWVDVEICDAKPVKKLSKNADSSSLSPPGLYKEYDVYVEKAPLFVLKYRTHVASGR